MFMIRFSVSCAVKKIFSRVSIMNCELGIPVIYVKIWGVGLVARLNRRAKSFSNTHYLTLHPDDSQRPINNPKFKTQTPEWFRREKLLSIYNTPNTSRPHPAIGECLSPPVGGGPPVVVTPFLPI
jgi:hypothetical protein